MAPAPILFQKPAPAAVSPVPPAQPIFESSSSPQSPLPTPPTAPTPLLRLHLDSLSHKATRAFLSVVDPTTLLQEAADTVLKWLYDFPSPHHGSSAHNSRDQTQTASSPWPAIRSITLVLRPMSGIAYTTSIPLDADHKEIHLSLDYVAGTASTQSDHDRLRAEVSGIVLHEMVHVWQSYAEGSAPVGLTEGIADWVRLRAGLAPPHWKRRAGVDGRGWDDGYETTGWFLDWLECVRVGKGTVRRCNGKLREGRYDEKRFWMDVCGEGVEVLWGEYGDWLAEQGKDGASEAE